MWITTLYSILKNTSKAMIDWHQLTTVPVNDNFFTLAYIKLSEIL